MYAQMQEAEKKHQEERERLQVTDVYRAYLYFHYASCKSVHHVFDKLK